MFKWMFTLLISLSCSSFNVYAMPPRDTHSFICKPGRLPHECHVESTPRDSDLKYLLQTYTISIELNEYAKELIEEVHVKDSCEVIYPNYEDEIEIIIKCRYRTNNTNSYLVRPGSNDNEGVETYIHIGPLLEGQGLEFNVTNVYGKTWLGLTFKPDGW